MRCDAMELSFIILGNVLMNVRSDLRILVLSSIKWHSFANVNDYVMKKGCVQTAENKQPTLLAAFSSLGFGSLVVHGLHDWVSDLSLNGHHTKVCCYIPSMTQQRVKYILGEGSPAFNKMEMQIFLSEVGEGQTWAKVWVSIRLTLVRLRIFQFMVI